MASTDAKPVPQKNVAFRVTFPILDADGDLVTGATGLDSEVSKDGGTFADVTAEATEIATSSGVYYLDLTSTEMNADTVAIIVKTSSVGAKTTTIVLYPEEAGDIRVNVTQFGSTNGTFSGGRPEVNTTHAAGTAWGSGAITAGSIGADAFTAAKFAADVTTELQSGLATASAVSTLQTSVDDVPTNAELATALDPLPTAAENAAALMDLSNGIETSITPRQAMRLMLAAMAGKVSGAGTTTVVIRNVGDSKDRITATVDADGNRSAVTTDGT